MGQLRSKTSVQVIEGEYAIRDGRRCASGGQTGPRRSIVVDADGGARSPPGVIVTSPNDAYLHGASVIVVFEQQRISIRIRIRRVVSLA